mgnify:CR=1 FL=1
MRDAVNKNRGRWWMLAVTLGGAALQASACGPHVARNEPTETSVDGSDTSHDPPATSGGPEPEEPVVCDNPAFRCSTPPSCGTWSCGTVTSPLDSRGCPRASCKTGDDCLHDEVCFSPSDWGMCIGNVRCDDASDGTCACVGDEDCDAGYCIPSEIAPPSAGCDPSGFDACMNSGCSPEIGRPLEMTGPMCTCQDPMEYCIWWPGDASISARKTAYVRVEDDAVIRLEWRIQPPPLGWVACDDLSSPPPACSCGSHCD